MENILPRKYNNPVVIGLSIALIVAIGVAIYYMYKSDESTVALEGGKQAKAPEHVETKVLDDNNKPVLLLVWASWCGHSTEMKPAWDKVANILNSAGAIEAVDFESANPKVVAEIDHIRQTLPNEFRGFPHIRFYPDGYGRDKKSITYKGERSEDEMLKFAYKASGM